jgi:uncharacterized protein YceK
VPNFRIPSLSKERYPSGLEFEHSDALAPRTNMYRSRLVTAVLAGLACAGCGTLDNLHSGKVPYGGVATDIDFAMHGNGYVEDIIFRPIAVIDTPISLVCDTATLPITLYASARRFAQPRIEEMKRRKLERDLTVDTPPPHGEPSVSSE